MKALIKTKSNYKGLNGKWLDVKEIADTRVSCLHYCQEYKRWVTIDFNLGEIVQFTKLTLIK